MNTKRHVAVLAINYPPEPSGNAPYAGALAEGMARRDCVVDAYVPHPHYPVWKVHEGYGQWSLTERINGVTVHRMRHYIPNPPRGLRRLISEFSFGVRQLMAPRKGIDAYLALSPALFSTWIASWRMRKTPLVMWVQDIYALGLAEIGEGGGLAAKVTKWVEKRLLGRASRVVVIHERFKERLLELYGLDADKVLVMRNWTYVPSSDFADRDDARAGRGWGDDTVVLYTGNFGAKQGLENVIEAARLATERNEPVRFVLMGGGGEDVQLRQRAGLSGEPTSEVSPTIPRLEFCGPLPSDEFRRALVAADVLLVSEKPGVAESSVPSKMATYFDAARPVISAGDPNGITASELELAQAGVSVPAGDAEALLAAALELRADPDRVAQLGMNGRHYRDTVLDQEKALDRWREIVEEIIAEAR